MHNAIIFQGVLGMTVVAFVYLLEGKQMRREQDEIKRDEAVRMHDLANQRSVATVTGTEVDVCEVPFSPSAEVLETPLPSHAETVGVIDLESGKEIPPGTMR